MWHIPDKGILINNAVLYPPVTKHWSLPASSTSGTDYQHIVAGKCERSKPTAIRNSVKTDTDKAMPACMFLILITTGFTVNDDDRMDDMPYGPDDFTYSTVAASFGSG